MTKIIQDVITAMNPAVINYNITATKFSKKGWPDMLIFYKNRYIALEIKGDGDSMSEDQESVACEIARSRGVYFVISSKGKEIKLHNVEAKKGCGVKYILLEKGNSVKKIICSTIKTFLIMEKSGGSNNDTRNNIDRTAQDKHC